MRDIALAIDIGGSADQGIDETFFEHFECLLWDNDSLLLNAPRAAVNAHPHMTPVPKAFNGRETVPSSNCVVIGIPRKLFALRVECDIAGLATRTTVREPQRH